MDFITDLPFSEGHDFILVVVDRFTKMVHFIPCSKAISGLETTNLVFANVVGLHGLPDDIISDCGAPFVSHFWKHLFHILSTTTKLSTTFHPYIDRQTKRVNQVLSQTHQPQTQTEHRWWGYERWVTNLELEVTRLGTLEVVSDMRAWRRDEEMEWNENTRLMCQWLVLNPLKGTKDVTSIYIVSWSTCIIIF